MKKFTAILIIVFSSFIALCQQSQEARPGTYQLRVNDPKHQSVALTSEALIYFETLRSEKEDVEVRLSDFVVLILPSRNRIDAKGYEPIPSIIYTEE